MHMLNDHDNDALLRRMIAMLVQYNDGIFYANEMVNMTWCNCHDAGPMMQASWRNDDALDVCMYEIHKHDAHMDKLMMHIVQCAYRTHFPVIKTR